MQGVEDEEDPDETPAEKRLRLAQMYLDGVKETLQLGACSLGSCDAVLICLF